MKQSKPERTSTHQLAFSCCNPLTTVASHCFPYYIEFVYVLWAFCSTIYLNIAESTFSSYAKYPPAAMIWVMVPVVIMLPHPFASRTVGRSPQKIVLCTNISRATNKKHGSADDLLLNVPLYGQRVAWCQPVTFIGSHRNRYNVDCTKV